MVFGERFLFAKFSDHAATVPRNFQILGTILFLVTMVLMVMVMMMPVRFCYCCS
jgi:hypothetical protein